LNWKYEAQILLLLRVKSPFSKLTRRHQKRWHRDHKQTYGNKSTGIWEQHRRHTRNTAQTRKDWTLRLRVEALLWPLHLGMIVSTNLVSKQTVTAYRYFAVTCCLYSGKLKNTFISLWFRLMSFRPYLCTGTAAAIDQTVTDVKSGLSLTTPPETILKNYLEDYLPKMSGARHIPCSIPTYNISSVLSLCMVLNAKRTGFIS
jgi:hypothetical protein